jgi:hypothetical protein
VARKPNKTGRSSKSGRFVALPELVLESAAYRDLSPVARALLVEILRVYNGKNNEHLGMSCRMAADRVGCSKDTANRALQELVAHGLIESTSKGQFSPSRIRIRATEWRVTWLRSDFSHSLPSKAFLKYPLSQTKQK